MALQGKTTTVEMLEGTPRGDRAQTGALGMPGTTRDCGRCRNHRKGRALREAKRPGPTVGPRGIVTKSPGTHVEPLAAAAKHGGRLLPQARYRHPPECPGRAYCLAGLQLAGNVTPLVRGDVILGYGPNLVGVLNKVPAFLDTGTLRAVDARVELARRKLPAGGRRLAARTGADPGGGDVR